MGNLVGIPHNSDSIWNVSVFRAGWVVFLEAVAAQDFESSRHRIVKSANLARLLAEAAPAVIASLNII